MAKNSSTEQQSTESTVEQSGLPETTKPEGEGYTDSNAGPDAKQGTVADESPDPEEAK
jgi:hypothetical protein